MKPLSLEEIINSIQDIVDEHLHAELGDDAAENDKHYLALLLQHESLCRALHAMNNRVPQTIHA